MHEIISIIRSYHRWKYLINIMMMIMMIIIIMILKSFSFCVEVPGSGIRSIFYYPAH